MIISKPQHNTGFSFTFDAMGSIADTTSGIKVAVEAPTTSYDIEYPDMEIGPVTNRTVDFDLFGSVPPHLYQCNYRAADHDSGE